VSIPLDANIVLIHGANAAGKTSILSALDKLALTGGVASLERSDPSYRNHLIHREAIKAQISISTTGLDASTGASIDQTNTISVTSGLDSNKPVLATSMDARFFSERCYPSRNPPSDGC